MNVYDAAHELARALSRSQEYLELKAAREELKKDPQAEGMLKDLRTKQLEVEALKLSGKPSEEAEKQLQNLYNIVSCHSGIRKYLEAEKRFLFLMTDIQKIIARAVDLDNL
ncbi:MAG: YlbF family regulator [Thermosediminibacteraceae bacterium]|nr:YlbF family regulator [Thermosediminibacteraceae bacterium]